MASTLAFIEAYLDASYTIDQATPVNESWNAAFGRCLKRHAHKLGLREARAKQSIRVADDGRTCCSLWARAV
jgi:hypothetical protein